MGNAIGKRVKPRTFRLKKRADTQDVLLPRLKIHPLFILLGVFYLFTGDGTLFFVSAIVALQHEYAHAFASAKVGVRLNKVVLMPYGAVIDGGIDGAAIKDEISIALAGPLCNLLTAAFFIALWWLIPDLYPFTDVACSSSLAVGLINLLPAYPLDGGRVLFCLLNKGFLEKGLSPIDAEKKSRLICRIITILFSIFLVLLFFIGCINNTRNLTLLFFSVFLVFGAFGNAKKTSFERIPFLTQTDFSQGTFIRRVAVDSATPIRRAVRFFSRGEYVFFDVYEKGVFLGTVSQNDFCRGLERLSFYSPMRDFLAKNDEN